MVQAGEASGNLDTILMRLSQYMENMARLLGKIKSAMTYPIAVLIIALVMTSVILIKVVPTFQDLFEQLGASLPAATQLVVDASKFLRENLTLIFFASIGLVIAFKSYNKTYKGRRVIDSIKLKM